MKTILLVEHDSFLINVYANQFRKLGYSTTIAPDGEAALLRIKSVNPDLVVLNIGLPQINGIEVLKTLRHEFGLKELKVVMLSDFYQHDNANMSAELGALRYFSKIENTAEEIATEIRAILS